MLFPSQALAQQKAVPAADLLKPDALTDMALGDPKATVTIIEYASMTCPHCAHFQETTFPELKKRYIDTGKVRYIFREFPLDSLAAAAFMLARCSAQEDSGKYFALIDSLFRQQRTWAVEKPLEPLFAIAKQAGFTKETFDACLSNQKVLDGIESGPPTSHQRVQGRIRHRLSSSMAPWYLAPSPSTTWPRSSTRKSRADKGFLAPVGLPRRPPAP